MTKAFIKNLAPKTKAPKPAKKCCCAIKEQSQNVQKSCCKKSATHTEIVAEYDVGFGNVMFIRGCCPKNLNWDTGVAMVNFGKNLWRWSTNCSCKKIEFKLLINDQQWSTGENFIAENGKVNHVIVSF